MSIAYETIKDCGGTILSPMMKNRWRLVHWGKLTPDQMCILTIQALGFNVSSASSIMDNGTFNIQFEHDVGGEVFARIQELPIAEDVHIEFLDGDNTPLTSIVLHKVIVETHGFDAHYALSETLKSVLTCNFQSMTTHGSVYEWPDK